MRTSPNIHLTKCQYVYECLDSHAVTVGTDGNKFRPRCQCMSGFETSGPTRGKVLKEGEVCLPCLGTAEHARTGQQQHQHHIPRFR